MTAASNVVPLFGQCAQRNRKEDEEMIRLRRIISTMQGEAFRSENATAQALSRQMERKLPRNQLRLLAGTKDERRDFEVRLQDVEIADAERRVVEAKRWRNRILYGDDAMRELDGQSADVFDRYRQAVVDMANTPVFTKADIRRKRAAIGTVWLRAQGAWYDPLRAAVAADEARCSQRKGA